MAVQTVIGARDSRLVVKLGEMNFGSLSTPNKSLSHPGQFSNDYLRFRVQWSELRVTLDEGRRIEDKSQAFFESALDRIKAAATPASPGKFFGSPRKGETWVEARKHVSEDEGDRHHEESKAVCTLLLFRFTIDWQVRFYISIFMRVFECRSHPALTLACLQIRIASVQRRRPLPAADLYPRGSIVARAFSIVSHCPQCAATGRNARFSLSHRI